MIEHLAVTNFKNLASVEEAFGPVNVVIGPNGCGKSSLLQAVDFLRAFFYSSIDDYLRERGLAYADLPNLRKTHKRIAWKTRIRLSGGPARTAGLYEYEVSLRRWRYLGVGAERLTFAPEGGPTQVLLDRNGRSLRNFLGRAPVQNVFVDRTPRSLMADLDERLRDDHPAIFHFRDWVMGIRCFDTLDPKVLRQPARGRHVELGQSGEHLPVLLAALKRREPQAFARLVARIRRFFPTVSDIVIRGRPGWGWQEITLAEANGENIRFNSRQMSDGILRFLALSMILFAEKPPTAVLIEEPEDGIHPQLIVDVVGLLREFAHQKAPRTAQVFFTTHSPYVVDQFLDEPDAVHIMERGRPQEGARIQRLSTRQDARLVRELYEHSLGEAWFTGVIGGTASGRR